MHHPRPSDVIGRFPKNSFEKFSFLITTSWINHYTNTTGCSLFILTSFLSNPVSNSNFCASLLERVHLFITMERLPSSLALPSVDRHSVETGWNNNLCSCKLENKKMMLMYRTGISPKLYNDVWVIHTTVCKKSNLLVNEIDHNSRSITSTQK